MPPPPPSRPPFPLLGTPGFPEPLPPTKAVVQLALISNVTPFRTKDSLASHSNCHRRDTFESDIVPVTIKRCVVAFDVAADGNSSERSTAQQPGVRALWVGEKYVGEDDLTLHVGKNLATASVVQFCQRAYGDHVRSMDPTLLACLQKPRPAIYAFVCAELQKCPARFTLQPAEVQSRC